ncbi:exported hypothetical protein [Leuconostoc carnosum]|nr:exported hypothetical protein [Leuconostoc carnosum]SPO33454.1 exported hypothetical protein [Leuconostoc carnosum]
MSSRQIQMIGLASGIGTGLFLSSAYTIHTAGLSIIMHKN